MKKLVRDRIPDILTRKRIGHKARAAGPREYRKRLEDKLREEVEEFLSARGRRQKKEELADIFEVCRAYLELIGANPREIERIRRKKLRERGGFSKRIVLELID